MRTAPSASRLQPSAPWTSPWATAQRRSGGPAARRAAPSRSRADRASRRAASIEWSPTHLQQCFRLHEHICRGAARGRRRERRGLDELQRLRRVPRRVCSPKRCDDVCSHGAARARSSCREAWSRVANWHMHFYVVVRPSIEWIPSLRLSAILSLRLRIQMPLLQKSTHQITSTDRNRAQIRARSSVRMRGISSGVERSLRMR